MLATSKESGWRTYTSDDLCSCWKQQTRFSCAATSVANILNAFQTVYIKSDSNNYKLIETIDILGVYRTKYRKILSRLIDECEEMFEPVQINRLFIYLAADFKKYSDQRIKSKVDLVVEKSISWIKETYNDQWDNARISELAIKLKNILRIKIGICKLTLSEVPGPSTAIVSNNILCKTIKTFASDHTNFNVMSKDMMCNRTEPEISWKLLVNNLKNDTKQMIFHMTNHYAPIYAAREIIVGDRCERQILTSMVDQTPSIWLDWDQDVLRIIDSGDRYRIMEFETVQKSHY